MKRNLKMWTGLFVMSIGFGGFGCTSQRTVEKALDKYFSEHKEDRKKEIVEALNDFAKQAEEARRPKEPTLEERMKNRAPIDPGSGPIQGDPSAPITMVEFSDFQCPFCKRVLPTVNEVMKEYKGKVKLTFRQNPLPFHDHAESAAKASLAAEEQGKFWEMHDLLFENQQDLSDGNIEKLAKKAGLNLDKFKKSWKSDKFKERIQKDVAFAQQHGANGTPGFFINGVLISGAQPKGNFAMVIDKLLKE